MDCNGDGKSDLVVALSDSTGGIEFLAFLSLCGLSDPLGGWSYGDDRDFPLPWRWETFSVYINEQPSGPTATSSYPLSGTAMHANFSYGGFQSSQNPFVGIIEESISSGSSCACTCNVSQGDGSYTYRNETHSARPQLLFDPHGRLYVSIGSANNVDGDSRRARLRRFDLPLKFFTKPLNGSLIDFSTGAVVADGLRNTVGMSFDRAGNLWGLDNGADGLVRPDLGGDIHMDNPADELNLLLRSRDDSTAGSLSSPSLSVTVAPTDSVDEVRSTYAPTPAEDMSTSVPSVGSNSNLPNQSGTATHTTYMKNDRFSLTEKNSSSSAAPTSFLSDGVHTDEWCRRNTAPAALSIQAHSAPLGMTFFDATSTVVRVPMKRTGGGVSVPNADGGPIDFLCSKGPGAEWIDQIRPVDVKFDGCKRLLVSTDGGSFSGDGILIVEYNRPAKLGDDSLSSKSFSNVTCGSGNK
eukprot:gene25928-34525_t